MSYTQIAYSLLIQYKDAIYGIRDPYGNRPLCVGKLQCALDDAGMCTDRSLISFLASFLSQ